MATHNHYTQQQQQQQPPPPPRRPFSYELRVPEGPPPQPSPDALEQARRLREAALAHSQRTGGPSNVPHEEFSYLETPIDDNTQSFSEAPPHVRDAIEQARISSGTPRASAVTLLPPHAPERQQSPPQQFHDTFPQPYTAYSTPPTESAHAFAADLTSPSPVSRYETPLETARFTPQPDAAQPQFTAPAQYTPPLPAYPIPLQQQTHQPQQEQPQQQQQQPQQQQQQRPPPQQQQQQQQPPARTGPVAIKSEEDLKTRHALQAPNHAYASDPKLQPYVPYGSSPATAAAPFSPAALTHPATDRSLHQPGQAVHPGMNAKAGPSTSSSWTHGLCACPAAGLGTCFTGLVCPCIIYSRTSYRLAQRNKKGDPTDMLGHSSCDGNCVLFSLACGFQGILTFILGTRVRHAYDVDGDGAASEFCKACCCCCCSLVQSEREVGVRESEKNRWAGPSVAYVAREQMAYRPVA